MKLSSRPLSEPERQKWIQYCFEIIGCMQYVHNKLGPAQPEPIYQEALYIQLQKVGYQVRKEYIHHPTFDDITLEAYTRMDLVVVLPTGNVIIECKSISHISDREQLQTFGYLCATHFPVALLVNFGTYPKAEIERYVFQNDVITAF